MIIRIVRPSRMPGPHHFCTDLARDRGEPFEGTGAFSGQILLLRWPRAKWRVPRSSSPGLPPAIATGLDYLDAQGGWCCMVDGADGDIPDLIAYPGNIRIDGDDLTLAAAIRDHADGKRPDGIQEERTVVLCCVDSRTDACCARFGFATYKAMNAAADRQKLLVLMSCHLGGCRFASSVMVPQRKERYGRLRPDDAESFIAAIVAGETYLPRFKGRYDLDEPAQVAELAARRWAAKSGRDADAIALSPQHTDGGSILRFDADVAGQRLTIRLEARDFLMHGQCETLNGGHPAELSRRWLVRDVTAA
jgi:hypothetical protein